MPGDILFSDDFNRISLPPWTSTNPAVSGILVGGPTSGSPPRAAYTSNQAVFVDGPTASGGNNPSFNILLSIRIE